MTTQTPGWPDLRAILDQLGAAWSPDFDAYASGQPGPFRCVLCRHAPCACRNCTAVHRNRYHKITGRPESEVCGMTIDPATGKCPRGCGETTADA